MQINAIQACVPSFGANLKRNNDTAEMVRNMTLPELKEFQKGLNKLKRLDSKDTLEIVRQTQEEPQKEEPSFFKKVLNKIFGEKDNVERIKYVLVNRDDENSKPMDITPVFSWTKGSAGTIWTKKICDAINYAADGHAEGLFSKDTESADKKEASNSHSEYPFAKFSLQDQIYESDERFVYYQQRTLHDVNEEYKIKENIFDMLK